MKYNYLLIEINTEEMPPKYIRNIAKNFYNNIASNLYKHNIQFNSIKLFDTPRRIALQIQKIHTTNTIQHINQRGPSIKNAFNKEGLLTDAALKWLKKFHIHITDTKVLQTVQGAWLSYKQYKKKKKIKCIIPKIIIQSIKNISIIKSIQWNEYDIKFIRPIRNILILLDNQYIIFDKMGISTKKYLQGNIATIPKKIQIYHAKEYENILYKKGKVIANYYIRKKIIQYKSTKISQTIGGKIKNNTYLLKEITCLVEWPNVLHGKFKKKFLNIPKYILIHILEKIQKYLIIYKKNNQITNHFIIISNLPSKKSEKIIQGNQIVLQAKLSDTVFFLKNDQYIPLKSYFILLKKIIFQEALGSMFHKTKRLIHLIQYITQYTKANLKNSTRAAFLSKCDLKTSIVYEYPELQGIAGMYYAKNSNEQHTIAISIKEQYQPTNSNKDISNNVISYTLSLTDKIDTIVGFFLINQIPKNNKDPFYLRRIALNIIQIILEKKININLYSLIKKTIDIYNINSLIYNPIHQIITFIITRLKRWYRKKYHFNIIESVLSVHKYNLVTIDTIIKLLFQYHNTKKLNNLIIIYKRISNLFKIMNMNDNKNYKINYSLIKNKKEKIIFIKTKYTDNILNIMIHKKKYHQALKTLFQFYNSINYFLNNISIQYSHPELKINRVTLLLIIKNFFKKITHFTKLSI
ncbi:Glycine--tRNA ligase beta subunit [Buchnera aphidicola (Pterocallis alni)]|uniref:glycine--tRNA ligase subunit beta n=1 Tax=Buchnera aphidicola TaxID=9 RepID=UPI0034649C8D